jgi:hypothetical protein
LLPVVKRIVGVELKSYKDKGHHSLVMTSKSLRSNSDYLKLIINSVSVENLQTEKRKPFMV